ncbi:metal-dependent hydrolase family protein [Brevibacterium luteolum]|uniref:metal-dependent hydrolase family protein n=1 Tax=Brevibacterium luteolum TaxID=199591 RepID=UPI00223A91D4|nr:amidohydrolase family protein [Brevibacterium luteolum]MCT1874263.1 amidohydrolase family protein [Brevibacterium luteolum]MCT1891478.1 amidohydrolase family protein [Brevibacterium luteolum]MCT1894139.1 amidohydrolase family protein [Brevibacterium luteolum]MCT1924968.1 amidohydrolase family protein [Brevibacterium luteolum]
MHLDESITAITNVRILDPVTETVSEPQSIQINGDRISSISAANNESDSSIDAGGAIAIPGLIDCHVHVLANTADLGRLGDESPAYLTASAINTMQGALRRGFTTLRDAGGADFGLARAAAEQLFLAPRLFFGGKALSQTGGHADMRGPGTSIVDQHQCCPHIGTVCDGVDEVRKAARMQLRTGADHIKIMLSGGVASPTDRIDSTQFSDEEIRAAVEEAAASNRYVLGHAYTARAINRGLKLGVRSIEHGNLLDDESIRLFTENDAFLVPTLVTYERLKAEGVRHGLPQASADKVDSVLYAGLKALEAADQGGVNIAYGSDLLGDMWKWQSKEFEIRSQVQSAGAVLRSATTVAARLLNQEGELGIIREGAQADIVLLNANPLDDITVLAEPQKSVRHVLVRGGLVHA